MRIKRSLGAGLLGIALFALAGCGNSIMDTYSFGNQVFHVGQSEVIAALPFETAKNPRIQVTERGNPLSEYDELTKHVFIVVRGEESGNGVNLPTIEQAIAQRNRAIEQGGATITSNKQTPITLDGVPAVKVDMSFDLNGSSYRFLQYLFVNQGVLWNISYQYPSDDVEGAQITKFIEGKIQITKKEG